MSVRDSTAQAPELLSCDTNLLHGKQYSYSYSARPASFNASEAVKLTLHCWCAYMDETSYGTMAESPCAHFKEGIRSTLEDGFGGLIEPQELLTFVDDPETDTQAYVCESKVSDSPVKAVGDGITNVAPILQSMMDSTAGDVNAGTKAESNGDGSLDGHDANAFAVKKKAKRVCWADETPHGGRRGSIKPTEKRSITISCRGSTSLRDWITNLTSVRTNFEPSKGTVGGT